MCITESQHFISTILKKIKLKKIWFSWLPSSPCFYYKRLYYSEIALVMKNQTCMLQIAKGNWHFVVQFTQLLGSFCMVECSVLLDTLLFFDFRISLSLILFLLLWFLLSSLWYFILLTWWSHWSLLQLSLGLSFLSS